MRALQSIIGVMSKDESGLSQAAPTDCFFHLCGFMRLTAGRCINTICNEGGRYVSPYMCVCLRSTVSHPGSQAEATDSVM